ncbi:Sulfatase N-terminal [Trinorchestia longiramus]|nr:Sulfatase N-terminal [Trinorchestia longiramus]
MISTRLAFFVVTAVCAAVISIQHFSLLSIDGAVSKAHSSVLEASELHENSPGDQTASGNTKRPNVLIFLVDDLGFGDLSFMGHPTSQSPAIDRLAAQSKVFTQFYVTSPVCSPSRASILTGRYQTRSGIYPGVLEPDNPRGLPVNETTIAKLLQRQGYRTLITGKWHLGVGYKGEYLPAHHGFDDYLGVPYSHDMCPCYVCFPDDKPCYDTCWDTHVSCALISNTTIVEQPTPLPSLAAKLLQKATDFLEQRAQDKDPFFLYMPFMHVHHPQFSAAEFEGKSTRGIFGEALLELDHSIHSVVQTLDRLKLANDTIIWFLSDNGPSLLRQERGGCAGPLRCGKGTTWEGGVRVPAFVRWPGHVAPGRTDALLSSLELLPTIAALTSADTTGLSLDGVDASSFLLGLTDQPPRKFFAVYPVNADQSTGPHAVVYKNFKTHFYTVGSDLSDNENYDEICTQKHKLTAHNPPLLYDLSVDPGERWNIANNTKLRETMKRMEVWRTQHMQTMTWMQSVTTDHEPRSQPCCTDRSCDPFPTCCDCPAK